jgi:hypothetical protein
MIGSQTLPALAFLAAISGLPGLKGLPLPASKEYNRARAEAVAADTLPVPWKPSWRLALENHFVQAGLAPIGVPQGPIRLQPQADPRRVRVSVDPVLGTYRSTVEVGEVTVAHSYVRPMDQFSTDQVARTFRERWSENARRNVNTLGKDTPTQRTGGLSLPIPVRLPQRLSSILGPGGPALNVSGSESIRLSGTSNWTNAQVGIIGQRKSLFPSLDLQQDLDIRLEGQLSDRIKVNLLQNSANQVPLANRIAINYRGDEDDFVQALDLGNTSLALPGTQYVSYSGKNEGLFGVKFASRVGALDFTALASKQEGRSERAVYTGGGARSKYTFTDLDWVKGQYFLLYDPGFGTVYDVDESSIRLYLDDGIASNDLGKTIPGRAVIDPDGSMGIPLRAASDTASYRGSFDILNPGPDQQYEVLNNFFAFRDSLFKVVRLRQPIPVQSNQTLAITYRATPVIGAGHQLGAPVDVGGRILTTPGPDSGATLMKLLRVARRDQVQTTDGVYDTTAAFAPVRELELKNVYNLGGYQIDPKSFKLTLQLGQDEPPITDLNGVPFLEAVGLDNWDEQSAQARRGHDGVVDGIGFNSQTRGWVDHANGTLVLPDLRPFAPRLAAPGGRPFDQYLDAQLNRRIRLDGPPDVLNRPNPGAYELFNPLPKDAQWYFTAEFAAARSGGGDITLGRGNILDNSEAVVVNGERWVRDRDYTIDYDLGRLTLKRQLGPSDQLSVDYSYAPLFAQASKTLIGSAFRLEGRDRSLGGAFLYESKGAQDLRPRLGEEPSRTLITDLNTEWRFRPSFLTRLANALPGVRTTTPSELNVQAEAGMSFPNPNTRNEVFVDDMEGVRDAVSLSLTPDRWRWSGVPRRATSVVLGNAVATQSFLTLPNQFNAEVHWFVPVNTRGTDTDNELIRERDLRPKLTDAQGGQNVRNVLGISVPRTPNPALTLGYSPGDTLWAGLTYNLDAVGLDLSRAQFIELWVNDWNDHHEPSTRFPRVRGDGTPGSSAKLHINLGRVSEDQMRAPNRPPNARIDTEDQPPRDNQLTVIGDDSEDTGIDGLTDAQEQSALAAGQITLADLSTASSGDPEGDNWGSVIESIPSLMDPRRYVTTNGTERSKDAFPIPDTEDMNLDERPDTTEAYFEYTIDLGARDSPYLVTDVLRDFPGEPGVDSTRNGWRRYRIPLNDSLRVRFGFPDLSITQHVRLWVEGLREAESSVPVSFRPTLMLGGFDIVGSRWLATDLTPRQRDTLRTALTLNAVNTVDNADVYVAPFDPGTTRNGSQAFQRREQSMALEFTDLHPADTLEAFKTFSIPENYSRYGVLRWFAAGFEISKLDASGLPLGTYDPALDSLYYFVRFASDDKGQSYYEVKRRVPRSSLPQAIAWEEVLAAVERLSVVKLNPDFPAHDPILYRTALASGDSLILRGRPSFTRLLRVSFGVVNQSSDRRFTGQLWFDELRATDVAKDVGLANRVLVNGRWANLMDYNVAWNSRDADFLSVGETRGSGNRTSSLNVSTRFEPHRFFEGTGIILPVTFAQNEVSSRPRFTAGDDIVRSGALAAASETRSLSRTVSTSYSRVWNERSNPFLRYTVGGITANISRSTNDARTPTSVSNSRTVNAGVNYNVAPRSLLQIPMPFMKARFFPLPERAYWNYQVTSTRSEAFTRVFGTDSLRPSSSQNGRAASLDFGADTRPFDMLSHHIEGRRNLALDGVRQDRVGFVNFGRVTNWRQSFASHLGINPHPWLRPSFNWSSSYNQNNDTQSRDIGVRGITNGQELGVNWDFPFDKLTAPAASAARPAPRPDTAQGAARVRGPALPWRALLSRLGPLSADARLGRSTAYSRILGTASPLYLIGLAENPGFDEGRVYAQPGNTSSSGVDWRANARTNIALFYGSSLQSRFSYGDRTNNNNGVKSRNRDWRFPDVEVQYGRVATILGIHRILDSPQLRTAYARSTSVDYQNSRETRTGTSRSDDFRPLFSIRGRFKNGTDADLRLERRSSVRESFQQGNSKQTDQTTDINFSLTRSYSQGQKVNLLGKTTTVRTNVSLALTTVYSRQKGGIKVGNEEKLANPVDRTRLSVNGTGSYGFSTNVTGDLALGFSHFRETNGIIRRSVRVELRGQFRF